MKTSTKVVRTFEVGDMFIFKDEPVSGDAFGKGDFLLIEQANYTGFRFVTSRTVTGACKVALGDSTYLSRELDAGVLEYQGNVKVGV